jgi:hypothetical protein
VPKRAVALIVTLVAFVVIVLSLLAWANFSGTAGSQRGLVIRSEIDEDTVVRLADGRAERLGEGRRQWAFVVKREEFPQIMSVSTAGGILLFEEEFEYSDLAEAEFRISYDGNGFYRTTNTRDTPVPTP